MLLQSWKLKDFNSSTYSFKCKVIIIGADINVCALQLQHYFTLQSQVLL